MVGWFGVDSVAGKVADLCKGKKTGSMKPRHSSISCLVYKVISLKKDTGLIGEISRVL